MNDETFFEYRLALDDLCANILQDRGPAYAGEGGDRFANFNLIAGLLRNFHIDTATPQGTWAVYWLKHVFAILAYIGQGTEGQEKIAGRIADARNYLDLLYGMTQERAVQVKKYKFPVSVDTACTMLGMTREEFDREADRLFLRTYRSESPAVAVTLGPGARMEGSEVVFDLEDIPELGAPPFTLDEEMELLLEQSEWFPTLV